MFTEEKHAWKKHATYTTHLPQEDISCHDTLAIRNKQDSSKRKGDDIILRCRQSLSLRTQTVILSVLNPEMNREVNQLTQ